MDVRESFGESPGDFSGEGQRLFVGACLPATLDERVAGKIRSHIRKP
jgi:hypothetical protein